MTSRSIRHPTRTEVRSDTLTSDARSNSPLRSDSKLRSESKWSTSSKIETHGGWRTFQTWLSNRMLLEFAPHLAHAGIFDIDGLLEASESQLSSAAMRAGPGCKRLVAEAGILRRLPLPAPIRERTLELCPNQLLGLASVLVKKDDQGVPARRVESHTRSWSKEEIVDQHGSTVQQVTQLIDQESFRINVDRMSIRRDARLWHVMGSQAEPRRWRFGLTHGKHIQPFVLPDYARFQGRCAVLLSLAVPDGSCVYVKRNGWVRLATEAFQTSANARLSVRVVAGVASLQSLSQKSIDSEALVRAQELGFTSYCDKLVFGLRGWVELKAGTTRCKLFLGSDGSLKTELCRGSSLEEMFDRMAHVAGVTTRNSCDHWEILQVVSEQFDNLFVDPELGAGSRINSKVIDVGGTRQVIVDDVVEDDAPPPAEEHEAVLDEDVALLQLYSMCLNNAGKNNALNQKILDEERGSIEAGFTELAKGLEDYTGKQVRVSVQSVTEEFIYIHLALIAPELAEVERILNTRKEHKRKEDRKRHCRLPQGDQKEATFPQNEAVQPPGQRSESRAATVVEYSFSSNPAQDLRAMMGLSTPEPRRAAAAETEQGSSKARKRRYGANPTTDVELPNSARGDMQPQTQLAPVQRKKSHSGADVSASTPGSLSPKSPRGDTGWFSSRPPRPSSQASSPRRGSESPKLGNRTPSSQSYGSQSRGSGASSPSRGFDNQSKASGVSLSLTSNPLLNRRKSAPVDPAKIRDLPPLQYPTADRNLSQATVSTKATSNGSDSDEEADGQDISKSCTTACSLPPSQSITCDSEDADRRSVKLRVRLLAADIFHKLDFDRDSTISQIEFGWAFHIIRHIFELIDNFAASAFKSAEAEGNQAQVYFKFLDESGNGTLESEEFVAHFVKAIELRPSTTADVFDALTLCQKSLGKKCEGGVLLATEDGRVDNVSINSGEQVDLAYWLLPERIAKIQAMFKNYDTLWPRAVMVLLPKGASISSSESVFAQAISVVELDNVIPSGQVSLAVPKHVGFTSKDCVVRIYVSTDLKCENGSFLQVGDDLPILVKGPLQVTNMATNINRALDQYMDDRAGMAAANRREETHSVMERVKSRAIKPELTVTIRRDILPRLEQVLLSEDSLSEKELVPMPPHSPYVDNVGAYGILRREDGPVLRWPAADMDHSFLVMLVRPGLTSIGEAYSDPDKVRGAGRFAMTKTFAPDAYIEVWVDGERYANVNIPNVPSSGQFHWYVKARGAQGYSAWSRRGFFEAVSAEEVARLEASLVAATKIREAKPLEKAIRLGERVWMVDGTILKDAKDTLRAILYEAELKVAIESAEVIAKSEDKEERRQSLRSLGGNVGIAAKIKGLGQGWLKKARTVMGDIQAKEVQDKLETTTMSSKEIPVLESAIEKLEEIPDHGQEEVLQEAKRRVRGLKMKKTLKEAKASDDFEVVQKTFVDALEVADAMRGTWVEVMEDVRVRLKDLAAVKLARCLFGRDPKKIKNALLECESVNKMVSVKRKDKENEEWHENACCVDRLIIVQASAWLKAIQQGKEPPPPEGSLVPLYTEYVAEVKRKEAEELARIEEEKRLERERQNEELYAELLGDIDEPVEEQREETEEEKQQKELQKQLKADLAKLRPGGNLRR